MERNDWYEAGEQIVKLVQDAVDSKDFSQLGTTISDVVNDAVNGFQSALKKNINGTFRDGDPAADHETGHSTYEYTNRAAAEQIRRNIEERRRQQAAERAKESVVPVKLALSVPGEFSAKLTKWFGYGMTWIMGIALAMVFLSGVLTGEHVIVPVAILALLTGISYAIGSGGSSRLGLAKRFRRYRELIGERKFCLIEELASATGKSDKFVRKDINRMIEQGLFREGYMDRDQKTLITDKATYQQYLTTQTEFECKKLEGGAKSEAGSGTEGGGRAEAGSENGGVGAKKSTAKLTPEYRELIAEGKRYIQHVHECNEKIEDADMSAKLDRLELVITRIFREAEQNPDVVGDLKKMMSYYLPTTQKLLDAYCEMDEQPIQGQNIQTTQKEIERALDTINTAFENLLDSFFKDQAWDISSDITVLNTMLAQEGLTGKAFDRSGSNDPKV